MERRRANSHVLFTAAVLLALVAAGCGGTRRASSRQMCWAPRSAGGDVQWSVRPQAGEEAVALATDSVASERRAESDDAPECLVPREAPPWEPLPYTSVAEESPRVLLATLELPPGAYLRPPTSSCQDVIVLVRSGELEASGTGIAPEHARASLYVGDAARFGPEGDGLLVNTGDQPARTLLAVARDSRRFQRTSEPNDLAAHGGDCAALDAPPIASPTRVGSIATTEPRPMGAELSVRVMLDAEGQGAENAALGVLEGGPHAAFGEHRHEGSAEILVIDEGHGTLTLTDSHGTRVIEVQPGARIYIPAGVTHAFSSDGTRALRAVQLHAPSL